MSLLAAAKAVLERCLYCDEHMEDEDCICDEYALRMEALRVAVAAEEALQASGSMPARLKYCGPAKPLPYPYDEEARGDEEPYGWAIEEIDAHGSIISGIPDVLWESEEEAWWDGVVRCPPPAGAKARVVPLYRRPPAAPDAEEPTEAKP